MLRKVNNTNIGILLLIQVNLFVFCHKSNPNPSLWTFPVPDEAKTIAVYGMIQNPFGNEVSILSLESNQYKTVEFHTMEIDKEGIKRMRRIDFPILLQPNERIQMERGGTHLMLLDKQNGNENLMITIQYSNGKLETQVVEKKSL
ncbi:copper chaperone PCu(A)C [Leptospira jelokensis]|uniref:copper chaperone PCu(A)C n=1 Tax=Leptospira jelokensis TaxID=2484931 RepID=UPI001FD44F40|nr:copper chaperone PCu(A)C [Leptospira jelokensis]